MASVKCEGMRWWVYRWVIEEHRLGDEVFAGSAFDG